MKRLGMWKKRALVLGMIMVAAFLPTASSAKRTAPAGPTVVLPGLELVSKGNPQAASATAGALITKKDCTSADGRFVVFESSSDNLVVGQEEERGGNDIFLHDRVTQTTVLVTHAASSPVKAANDSSLVPSISTDGRYVVYWSFATDLVAGVTDANEGDPDVFLYDRVTATNTLVSHQAGDPNTTGESNSYDPAVSADGKFVAFTSAANNLVAGQTNGGASAGIFVWERETGNITLVSHAAGTPLTTADGLAFNPVLTGDGSAIAYLSNASNLVAGQTEDARRYDVFLWSRDTGASVLVNHSVSSPTTAANGQAGSLAMTADGRFITFQSAGTDLIATQVDPNQASFDVFVYERATGTNTLVSHRDGLPNTTGSATAIFPSISGDGRFIAYQSPAVDLTPSSDTNNTDDIFLWDRTTNTNRLITRTTAPVTSESANGRSFGARPSEDGSVVVFTSYATDLVPGQNAPSAGNVFRYDRVAGTTKIISHRPGASTTGGAGYSYLPLPSTDGAYVAFTSQSNDLVPQDNNSAADVMLYEDATGNITAASTTTAGTASLTPNGNSGSGRASADGRFVVFASESTNIVPGQSDANNRTDIFLRDRVADTMTLVSHAAGLPTQTAAGLSRAPVISADGRWVAFISQAPDIIAGAIDTTGFYDVFLYDRLANSSILVSHAAISPTLGALLGSETPGLSSDGRYLVYASDATDLVLGQSDANAGSDIFLFDRLDGSTRIVSHAAGAPNVTASDYSFAPAISPDGNSICYYSAALNLVSGQDNNLDSVQHLFVYDRASGTNQLIDHAAGSPLRTANGNAGSTVAEDPAVFSANGRVLAFVNSSTDLVPGQSDTNTRDDIFIFDRDTGVTTLASHIPGNAASTANSYSYSPSISADGNVVAYRSAASNLVAAQVDANSFQDVFAFNRTTGNNVLVSHVLGQPATAGNGASGDSPRVGPNAISPSGRWIAYRSSSTNLVADYADRNGINSDLYLFDTITGLNVLVSHAWDNGTDGGNGGTGDNQNTNGPIWSADSRWLVFGSAASDLIPGDSNLREDVFALPLINLLQPVSVQSVKTHGTAGTFGVDLPLAGTPGIECRSGGANDAHRIVLTFATPVTFAAANVSAGGGSVAGTSGNGTSQVTVDLINVGNAKTISVTLENANDGIDANDVTVPMSVLVGDSTASGSVNASDIGEVKAQSGSAVTTSNFRLDLNANGVVNSSDIGIAKSQSGTALDQP